MTRFSANLLQFSARLWLPMSTSCKCQKMQANVVFVPIFSY